MKSVCIISVILFCCSFVDAQVPNPAYDSTLANKFGADERGMKMYILVILKSGPNNVTEPGRRDSLFKGHFANINKLAAQKKLIVAGPLSKNDKSYRGIFILDVPTMEEARVLLDYDPTIKEKIFEVEMFGWYGSAGLPAYIETADKLRKFMP